MKKSSCKFGEWRQMLLTFALLFGFICSYAQTISTLPVGEKTLPGMTKGIFPYLKYGPGVDRLGGAKMTYLDTAVVLQIADSLQDDYIVRLTSNYHAFIPKEFVSLRSDLSKKAYSLTSSWMVNGDEQQDYVTIGLEERLPYQSRQLIDPSRIVVDIFGATGNTNWITQLKSAEEIEHVYHEQVADGLFRVTIQLKHPQHWGYSIGYRENNLTIAIKRQPKQLSLKKLRIAIDAGHGGSNTGATGIKYGMEEKVFNLQIAKYLEKELTRFGATVVMTREEDKEMSMPERIQLLREANPDLLISIHHNASSNGAAKGASTYYRYIGFKPLTVNILDRLLDLGLDNFGNVGSFNFTLNGPTEYPNCLVEVAFLSNEADEIRIRDPRFQKAVAKKIRLGIADWLKKVSRNH